MYKEYIKSLARQNYTNFKAIYADDASDDNTIQAIKDYIFAEYPEMSEKIRFMDNTERVYSLGKRDIAVR